jgi:glycosyltransferase involved in cell wall biosynthesis
LLDAWPDDFRYRLYFNETPPASAPLDPAEICAIPARRLWTHYRLSRELRDNPVDALFVPSHVLPLHHPARSVVTIHDLGYLYEPGAHTVSSRTQLRATTLWNARKASHLIAISESTKSDLMQHYRVDPGNISVVHHGVDQEFVQIEHGEVERYRRAARLPERFILYLGTIQPRKNLERLIAAFEYLALSDPDVHLILAGNPGWKSRPIRDRAIASGFSRRIRFLGRVPDEQLPALYNAATVFALPSLYEGFGLPVLEAMACGTPAVMSNRGALTELSGADVRVIDPEDTDSIAEGLLSALQIEENEDAVADRIAHARRFSWDDSARRTRDVLWNVVNAE